ncbi:hypothetical protein ACFL10_02200 [Patescibacteria group bacterium]
MMKLMNNNNFGKKLLVDNCQQIRIKPFIKGLKKNLKGLIITSCITIANQEIEIKTSATGNGGQRYWFSCPMCNRRAGVLYHHPINQSLGCRICLNLDYRKRRYKGMIESSL